jgi:hypothetical protein
MPKKVSDFAIEKRQFIKGICTKMQIPDMETEEVERMVTTTINRYCYLEQAGFSLGLLKEIEQSFRGGDHIALEQCAAKTAAHYQEHGLTLFRRESERTKQSADARLR